MKRFLLAAAAVAAVAGPLAISTEAAAQGRNDRYDYRDNRRDDRGDDRREYRDDRRDDRRDYRNERRDDRRDFRDNRRDDRRQYSQSWDNRRNNGYYLGNRWYYGPPPVAYYDRYDYRPGYQSWRRGQYLPPAYRGYVVNDYPRYRLRNPPRGYHWVQSGNDYILAAIATGLILEVISNGF